MLTDFFYNVTGLTVFDSKIFAYKYNHLSIIFSIFLYMKTIYLTSQYYECE